MNFEINALRPDGLPADTAVERADLGLDPAPIRDILTAFPPSPATPLVDLDDLAAKIGVAKLFIKDERQRMGLGSFKALGGACAVAGMIRDEAARVLGRPIGAEELETDAVRQIASGMEFVCASAGNHGLSVAFGASLFGARSRVYLSETVPEAFAGRLREKGAAVVRAGKTYEESMAVAALEAKRSGAILLSDSTWPGYVEPALKVMQGYTLLAEEAARSIEATGKPATHIVLQAGVGGMAASAAAYLRSRWGAGPVVIVVEPNAAPCLIESIRARQPVRVEGPVSNMGRLDCKEPSHVALASLAVTADAFVTVSDEEALAAVAVLAEYGIATTPSGAAGLAAMLAMDRGEKDQLKLDGDSRVLLVVSEDAVPEQ